MSSRWTGGILKTLSLLFCEFAFILVEEKDFFCIRWNFWSSLKNLFGCRWSFVGDDAAVQLRKNCWCSWCCNLLKSSEKSFTMRVAALKKMSVIMMVAMVCDMRT